MLQQDFDGWYIINGPNSVRIYKSLDWCKKNLPADIWEYSWHNGVFSFKNSTDALMFKLLFDDDCRSRDTQQSVD
jgi:hypothetical protein